MVSSPATAPGSSASSASEGCDFGERAITVVLIKIVHCLVCHEQIEPAVVVEIAPTATEATVQCGGCVGQLCERAIAVVAGEVNPVATVANEQIGKAVVVEVALGRAG